jgi:deazaflavin-dependent oxidoreductase (nitroreductase family)
VFRIPLPLYRAGLGWLLDRVFIAVTHVGRRTGEPHVMTAMVLRYDPRTEEAVIFSAWGPNTDWIRNLRARPAAKVQLGRREYAPVQRFLSADEAFDVAAQFCEQHRWRIRLARLVLGWPDLDDERTLRAFIDSRPFVAFRPAPGSP